MNLRLSIPKSIPSIHLKINVLVRKGSVHSSTQSVKSQYNDSNDSMWTGVRLLVEREGDGGDIPPGQGTEMSARGVERDSPALSVQRTLLNELLHSPHKMERVVWRGSGGWSLASVIQLTMSHMMLRSVSSSYFFILNIFYSVCFKIMTGTLIL